MLVALLAVAAAVLLVLLDQDGWIIALLVGVAAFTLFVNLHVLRILLSERQRPDDGPGGKTGKEGEEGKR